MSSRLAGRLRLGRHGARAGDARLKVTVAVVVLVVGVARAADLSPSVPRFQPHFPVFGGGRFVNIFDSDVALTNASAHLAWALAVPMAGEHVGGRKGLWISGVSWMTLSLVQEAFFHAPAKPSPRYPSEVRADLLTRLVPTAAILAWDLMRGGRARDATPAVIPAGPMRPLQDVNRVERAPGPLGLCLDVPVRARVESVVVTNGSGAGPSP
jgi:hypothetical protein